MQSYSILPRRRICRDRIGQWGTTEQRKEGIRNPHKLDRIRAPNRGSAVLQANPSQFFPFKDPKTFPETKQLIALNQIGKQRHIQLSSLSLSNVLPLSLYLYLSPQGDGEFCYRLPEKGSVLCEIIQEKFIGSVSFSQWSSLFLYSPNCHYVICSIY